MAASSKHISFIIATLNSAKVLTYCLQSIASLDYDQQLIEIIIADGGSTDATLDIARKFHCTIVHNPLKTAESAKAIGITKATGKFIALVDSDNILPDPTWLTQMLIPFKDINVIGSEPISYTYRPNGGFIERYCSLTGINDPYSLISHNYDRLNYLRRSWNGLNIKTVDYPTYQTFSINQPLPSIGANGTIYRRNIISKYFNQPYLIDVDLLHLISSHSHNFLFAKVKVGIIHTYCESSIQKFAKKQNRRVIDLYVYQKSRPTNIVSSQLTNNFKFTLYVILIFPMLFDTVKGIINKPDIAWFFHPLACLITLYLYGVNTIIYHLGLLKPLNRSTWQQ